jgi:hypothetical protein
MVDGRLLIWDVHRLVEQAKSLPVKTVSLSSIHELDESFWFDGESPTCREVAVHAKLIAETDLKYPIILSAEGRVMDGMHRVCKAFINNLDALSAVQFEVNPAPDYIDADIETLPYDEP